MMVMMIVVTVMMRNITNDDYFIVVIFHLNILSGHGLPAGLAEVEMIERARAKRIW